MEFKFDVDFNKDTLPGLIVLGGLSITGGILFVKWCASKSRKHKEKLKEEYEIRRNYANSLNDSISIDTNKEYSEEERAMVSYLYNQVMDYMINIQSLADHTSMDDYKSKMDEQFEYANIICNAITENNKLLIKAYYDRCKAYDKKCDERARRDHELKLKQMELDAEVEQNLRGVRLASSALFSLGRGLKKNED